MLTPSTFLTTKISIPTLCTSLLSRPRLLTLLQQSTKLPLTLVSASAGSGKSTLLSTWASLQRSHVAWLALSEHDNDPVSFWLYLLSALRVCHPELAQAPEALLRSPRPPDLSIILTTLINELAQLPLPLSLILDDYHVIEIPEIHLGLQFLLDHMPPNFHLLISSRIDPPFALSRLRARAQVLEIRDRDLYFTHQEANSFLTQTMSLPLSQSQVATLAQRTEGWITGLHLAALSLQKHQDPATFVQGFGGSHRFIVDYLLDEVLQRQPPHIQRFLTQTSILQRLHPSLCDALTEQDDSHTILASLEHANLFLLPLDEHRTWYRYHDLFREVLLTRLKHYHTSLLSILHQRAALWYSRHYLPHPAITHALASEDFPLAASLIESIADEMWMRGEMQTLIHWIKSLPLPFLQTRLKLSLTYAWVLYRLGQTEQGEPLLTHVEYSLTQPSTIPAPEHSELLGMLTIIRLTRLAMEGVGQQDQQLLLELLPRLQQSIDVVQHAWQLIPLHVLGLSYRHLGDFRQAVPTLQQAKQVASITHNDILAINIRVVLCQIYFEQTCLQRSHLEMLEAQAILDRLGGQVPSAGYVDCAAGCLALAWNQLEEAEALFQKGVERGRLWEMTPNGKDVLFFCSLELVRVYLLQGKTRESEHMLQECHTIARQTGSSHYSLWTTWLQVQTWLWQGDLTQAAQWAANLLFPPQQFNYFHSTQYLLQTELRYAQGRYSEASQMLDWHLSYALPSAHAQYILTLRLLQALLLEKTGSHAEALTILRTTLSQTTEIGYLHLYLERGISLYYLLLTLPQQDIVQPAIKKHLSAILTAFEQLPSLSLSLSPSPFSPLPLLEPLSQRELEVLSLLNCGLSNPAIAERLVVSLPTVKKHVGNILAKLAVQNRTQAVLKARELSLLP